MQNPFLSTTIVLVFTTFFHAQELTPRRIVGLEYPPLAAQTKTQGTVKIRCALDSDGTVTSTTVTEVISKQKTAEKLLGRPARENAAKWRFGKQAASLDNELILIYKFMLEGTTVNRRRNEFVFESPNVILVTSDEPYVTDVPGAGARKGGEVSP